MVVSVTLWVLARLTPFEWDNPYPCIEDPDEIENMFSLANSFWFTMASLMQQGSDVAPASSSNRLLYLMTYSYQYKSFSLSFISNWEFFFIIIQIFNISQIESLQACGSCLL